MDFAKEIKGMIHKAVSEAIDELTIKEQVRKHISSAITKEEIINKVDTLIDSYFRSAMNCNNVELYIKKKVDETVEHEVQRQIDNVIMSYSGWNGQQKIKTALDEALYKKFQHKYSVDINISQIASKENEGANNG